ncbi:MAG: hypothetical protein QM537_04415 [Candidatus Symbiobacter sp.]|nr:hypothetical protein [Candidatus Symbiobacter sp.]
MKPIAKIERDYLQSRIGAVQAMLNNLDANDRISRIGLTEHLEELKAELAAMPDLRFPESVSVALFFSGKPVIGHQGIESDFASKSLSFFQGIVTAIKADLSGEIVHERGKMRNSQESALHITGTIPGSFGFLLEEMPEQLPLSLLKGETVSPLQSTVDKTINALSVLAKGKDEEAESIIHDVNQRAFNHVKDFIELMHSKEANFRLVSGEKDQSFLKSEIERAYLRLNQSQVDENEGVFTVTLDGFLPNFHEVDFKFDGENNPIRGKVSSELDQDMLVQYNISYLRKPLRAKLRIETKSFNENKKQKFVFLGIDESDFPRLPTL